MTAMDVTPQLIEQIDFSEKFRGYDPDQVDDFLERVGATIAELSRTARDATQRAEAAEAQVRSGGAATLSDEEEAMQSTRTLMMAKRTADAAIADARQEANKIIGEAKVNSDQLQRDAQTEADRLVGEARVTADQMTQKAAAEANREYGDRRDQILAEIGELEQRKVSLVRQLDAVEGRLGDYRESLQKVHDSLGAVLEDPDAMLRDPIDGLDEPPIVATVADAPSEPEPSDEIIEPSAVTDDGDDVAHNGTSLTHTAFAGAAFTDDADLDAVAGVADSDDEGVDDAEPPSTAGPVDLDDADAPTGDAAFFDAPAPTASDTGFGGDAFDDAFGSTSGADDLPWADAPVAAAPDAEAGSDPWGPGSWGEASARSEGAFSFDDSGFSDAGPSDSATSGGGAFGDFPSEGLPLIGEDRYTRDLHDAVNQPDGDVDDAMAAFFEGDDEDQQTRRFGRRR